MKRRGSVNLIKAALGALVCCCLSLCAGAAPVCGQENAYRLENVTVGQIRYGQKLKECGLTGVVYDSAGKVVEGSLTWMYPERVMLDVGQVPETVLFTPKQAEPAIPPVETATSDETETNGVTEETKESREPTEESTEPAGEPIPKQQKLPNFTVYVQVGKGQTQVTSWPVVEKKEKVYDGDLLKEALSLQGSGAAICPVQSEAPGISAVRQERVPGSFRIQLKGRDPSSQKLEAGEQTVVLSFIPQNENKYESYSTELQLQVEPRPVTLTIYDIKTPLQTGEEIVLTARIWKEKGLENANGKISFYGNGKELAADLTLTETQDGWEAKTLWSPAKAGEYEMQAVYQPEDSHTDRAKSYIRRILAADPVTAILTEELPEGEVGADYEAEIKTDASGEFALQFSVTKGQLPEGLTLNEKNGTIWGTPKKSGEFTFTLTAKEKETLVSREFILSLRKKEKRQPKLTVSVSPEKITGGGDVTLKIKLEDPEDKEKKDGLPGAVAVSFDRSVGTRQSLQGKEGSYTYIFIAGNENGKIRCTVKSEENDFYTAAEASVDVVTVKEEAPEEKPSKKPSEKPKETPEKEPEKKEEPEPVKKTPEEIEAEFWQDVIFRIYAAQEEGGTVTINAKGHKAVSEKVMEALRTHDKVTLALVWEGDMIVIPAKKAPSYQKGVTAWAMADLSKMYPLLKPAPAPSQPPAPAPTQTPAVPQKPAPSPSSPQNVQNPSKGGIIIHEKTEPEETRESESVSPVTETQQESSSLETEAVPAVSTQEIQEEKGGVKIDWFLVAAGICAGTGIVAVTTAIAAMVRKKR